MLFILALGAAAASPALLAFGAGAVIGLSVLF